ncbi:MAG: 50S ribosomal protein L29 [Pedosphaera sp.]|nr:50S ribosomal protein L29 [Pedosphaera sp.]
MNYAEIKDLTEPELLNKVRDMRLEMFNLRLQKVAGPTEKPHRLREMRKDLARIQTRRTELRRKVKTT